MSVATLARSRPAAYVIWIFVFLGHLAALGFFTRGFLLTRQVLPDLASEASAAEFQRAVILVVDALRYDFVVPSETSSPEYYLNKMPLLELGGSVFEFWADPPTTTLQRLKGLTTGSLPTFIDAGSNFAGTEIEEDNWLLQAKLANKSVAFVGDDTWQALYGPIFSVSHPYPSLDVRDLDTVDNGVKSTLPELIANTSNSVVIGHMLGVDHVGHRYGPNHPLMETKMTETFEFIKSVAASIDDNTVLLVMGDHGMDQTGNHGGDSELELWAGLWAYAKRRNFGPGSSVQQIDFVPTISGLLGLPIPFNNLGFPIPQLLKNHDSIALATAKQISTYSEKLGYKLFDGGDPRAYQQEMLSQFRESWATFNMTNIYKGIGMLVLTLVSILSLYQRLTPANLTLKARRMCYGSAIGIIATSGPIMIMTQTGTLDVALNLIGGLSAGGLIMTVSIPRVSAPSWQNVLAAVLLALHCASFFSNSYVVWESKIVLFLLATLFVLLTLRCIGLGPVEQYIGVPCALLVFVALRASSFLYVCREEHGANCVGTFYEQEGTQTTGYWAIGVMSMLILGFPLAIRHSYTISENFVGLACLFLQGGVFLAFMLITIYWSMDTAEVRGLVQAKTFDTAKIVISRIVLGISAFAGPYIWAGGDPCVSVDINSEKPRIRGYQNVFGAYAYLPLIFVSWGIFIANKPPGIVAICALVFILFNASDLLDLTISKHTALAQVTFLLLAYMFFFATGHQMTLVSIQWDSAFISAKQLSYPISAITVFLNSLGPFILASMAAVLIAIWRRAIHKDARTILNLLVRSTLGVLGVATVQTIAVMVAATILRRHLMTWKIFAPRFIYGGLILGAIDLGALLGLIVGDHSVKKVTAMFGG